MTETRKAAEALVRRAASFAPSTFKPDSRTIDVVFTTGAEVVRTDWWSGERWTEALEVTREAVDLSRMEAGAPVLNAHRGWDLADVIGVVERAWIENGRGYATVRFSEREDVAPIMADVAAGILRNISVGYSVSQWREEEKDGAKRRTATRWQPMEISFVPIPADAAAQVRGIGADDVRATPANPATIKETTMTEQVTAAAAPPAAPIDANAVRAEAIRAERARAAEIREAARLAGLDDTWAQGQIDADATADAARAAALRAMGARQAAPTSSVVIVRDEVETLRTRLADAFGAKLANKEPTEAGREFRGVGFHGMIRELLHARGTRNVHRMQGAELFDALCRGMHTASDFTNILANSTNKSVRDMYGAYPNTWSSWVEEVEQDDFKTITAASVGQFPEPQVLVEGQNIRYGSIADEGETYAVLERARIAALSRVAIINDDAGALQRVVSTSALAGYTALRRAIFGVLTTNAAMADTVALFNAAHGNLGTAGNLSATTYGELWQLLAQQVGPARSLEPGETAAPLPPPQQLALIVSPAEVRTAYELVGNVIVPTVVGSTLPAEWRSMTEVVQDAFLNTGNQPYYLARKDIRAIEVSYLRGARTPQIVTAEQFDVSGVSFKIMFDFGVKAASWRTIAANLG